MPHANAGPTIAHALDEIVTWSATALSRRIHAREVSCSEVMAAYLAHIDAANPSLNALVSRRPSATLLAEAETADRELAAGRSRGWLHGIPQAIKDLSDVQGLPTVQGSPLCRDHRADADSLMVARMRAAGAIMIGKTNTPEFGLGSHTYNPVFGATRNAHAPTRTAGGSSGGAAAALAMRLLPVADGSDMMGSLRNPAAFNQVIGLRPSFGRVPGLAPEAFGQQLATNGPMGRSVEDVARLLAVQAGYDRRAPLSLGEALLPAGQDPAAALERDGDGLRIAWLGDWSGHLALEPGVLALCESALQRLEAGGCRVEPAPLPYSAEAQWQSWTTLRHWAVCGSLGGYYANPDSRRQLKPEAQWEVARGLALSAQDIHAANVRRSEIYRAWCALFERVDYVAMPSAQVFPFALDTPWPETIDGRSMDTYHRWMEVVVPASLAGLPAISVPAGVDARGLPMGLQLIGAPRDDWGLLQLARLYERISGELAPMPAALSG
ncbi:amidase [Salinicola sp. JS01]|uniref:amidase n=1 Tax=Salinicola sp. JS01 TaxID=3050071 RepID=UPI00255B8058|nr:amidase [Salinicola sp. JS01]WIX32422.1 amidase [Salinicola sp. JS01]